MTGTGKNKNEVADNEAALIVSKKVSWKGWNCTDEEKAKSLSVETFFNAIGFDIQISDMCNAFIGYMIWPHTSILDSICRTVNIIHSHFPTVRKVANN